MTMTKAGEQPTITQSDRDAANAAFDIAFRADVDTIDRDMEELFARHRTASLAAQDGLVEALEGLIEQCVACEKELTEVVYQTDYCGESEPLCNARKALSAIKGDKS